MRFFGVLFLCGAVLLAGIADLQSPPPATPTRLPSPTPVVEPSSTPEVVSTKAPALSPSPRNWVVTPVPVSPVPVTPVPVPGGGFGDRPAEREFGIEQVTYWCVWSNEACFEPWLELPEWLLVSDWQRWLGAFFVLVVVSVLSRQVVAGLVGGAVLVLVFGLYSVWLMVGLAMVLVVVRLVSRLLSL